ncbi:MAG: hypothetical protein ABSC48_08280 [Terracidiphilus sp.]|jgi:hypothetical protein
MSDRKRNAPAITPSEALESLPRIEFNPGDVSEDRELGRAELLQSVLAIAQIDHVAESKLVREVVRNALGKLPEIEE